MGVIPDPPVLGGITTARLADEDDPASPVILCDESGAPRVWMPLEVFRDLLKAGAHISGDYPVSRASMSYRGPSVIQLPATLAHLAVEP